MNDRLRDQIHDADPAVARAAALAAAVPAIAESEVRKERVRKAVLAAGTGRALLPLLLRPSVVLAILLVAGVVTGATLGRSAIVRSWRTLHRLAGTSSTPTMREASPRLHAPAQAQPAETAASEVVPAIAPVTPPATPPTPAASKPPGDGMRAARAAGRAPTAAPVEPHPSEPASESPAPTRAAPAQETALLMAAVRALRREHDPARAAALLDDYLRRYPDGVLAEEALAYAIEAASARGDARAATLARTYLQRYPHGRFEHAARAAIE